MAIVNIEIQPVKMDLAIGQSLGKWDFKVTDPSGVLVQSVQQDALLWSPEFPPGSYIAYGKRLDVNGADFGPTMAASFSVPVPVTPPMQGDAAGGVTVILAP